MFRHVCHYYLPVLVLPNVLPNLVVEFWWINDSLSSTEPDVMLSAIITKSILFGVSLSSNSTLQGSLRLVF